MENFSVKQCILHQVLLKRLLDGFDFAAEGEKLTAKSKAFWIEGIHFAVPTRNIDDVLGSRPAWEKRPKF